jgi:hypothetical protein
MITTTGGRLVSLKYRSLVGLAALAMASGTVVLGTSAANAATAKCGAQCITLAAQKYGATHVLDAVSGSSIVLSSAAAVSGEDWAGLADGTVRDFYRASFVSSAVFDAYGSDEAYEIMYAPQGGGSGKCLGVSSATANAGTAISLQPCGVSAKTLWINVIGDASGNFSPLVSAVTASTKTPYALTASSSTGQLTTAALTTTKSVISGTQMWEVVVGEFGSTTANPLPYLLHHKA